MAIPIEDYLTNITAMQLACGVTNADGMQAFKSNLQSTDLYPYWTNVLSQVVPTRMGHTWNYAITVVMRLHRDKLTAGIDGQIGLQVQLDIAAVVPYFVARQKSMKVDPRAQPVNGYRDSNARIVSGIWQIFPGDVSNDVGSLYTLEFAHIENVEQ